MKRITLLLMMALTTTAIMAAMPKNVMNPGKPSPQAQAPRRAELNLITQQPEGELRIYNRSGYELYFDWDTETVGSREQSGFVMMVFAADGAVYIQAPVQRYYTENWVKAGINAEGTLITLPLGQYVDGYGEVAYRLQLLDYDEAQGTYVPDETTTEVTYTVSDGQIALNGTSRQKILGLVYETTGYMADQNNTWTQYGDYESVYTPFADVAVTPPAGLQTETFTMTASAYSWEWMAYSAPVELGFDGDDAYVKGITEYMPDAWIKGRREGSRITFPTGQFLGIFYGELAYFVGAKFNGEDYDIGDLTFEFDGQSTYTMTDNLLITNQKDDLTYHAWYFGVTITQDLDYGDVVAAPANGETTTYVLSYQSTNPYIGWLDDYSRMVDVVIDGADIYVKGFSEMLPDAWVKGRIADGKAVFSGVQYMGDYEGWMGSYGLFFSPFDPTLETYVEKAEFDFDAATQSLTNATADLVVSQNRIVPVPSTELRNPSLVKFNDVALTPAAPIISYFSPFEDSEGGYMVAFIPTTSAEGETLDINKLSYQVYTDIETEVSPLTLTTEYYNYIDGDMTEIPYTYDNQMEVFIVSDNHFIYLNAPVADYNRVGIQSIYRGGGEKRTSDITWYDIKDYTPTAITGIATQATNGLVYTLSGQRVAAPKAGVYVVNGRKFISK